MTSSSQTWTAMTAVTIPVPASKARIWQTDRYLIGIALFSARCAKGHWSFTRYAHAIPAGRPGGTLLRGAVHRLPREGVLIGWNVDQGLTPALLNAAAIASPTSAAEFLERLHALMLGGVVDLALGHGDRTLAIIAADQAIYTPVWDVDSNVDDWAAGRVDRLKRDLADEALAIWRVFIRSAGFDGIDAERATDEWVERRKNLRIVAGANRAG